MHNAFRRRAAGLHSASRARRLPDRFTAPPPAAYISGCRYTTSATRTYLAPLFRAARRRSGAGVRRQFFARRRSTLFLLSGLGPPGSRPGHYRAAGQVASSQALIGQVPGWIASHPAFAGHGVPGLFCRVTGSARFIAGVITAGGCLLVPHRHDRRAIGLHYRITQRFAIIQALNIPRAVSGR